MRILVTLVAMMFPAMLGQAQKLDSGAYYLHVCQHTDPIISMQCYSLIEAVRWGNEFSRIKHKQPLYCAPKEISNEQMVNIYVSYLKSLSFDDLHNRAGMTVYLAMMTAFPCPASKAKP